MSYESTDATSDNITYSGTLPSEFNSYDLTLASWFKQPDDDVATMIQLTDKDAGHRMVTLGTLGGSGDQPRGFHHQYDGGSGNFSGVAASTYSLNTWHHACAVFTKPGDKQIDAYLDGGSKGTNTGTSGDIATHDRVTLFSLQDSTPTNATNLKAAEVAIWSAALTDAEVATLGAGFSPLFVRPASLILYLPLVAGMPLVDWINGWSFTNTGCVADQDHPNIVYPESVPINVPATVSVSSGTIRRLPRGETRGIMRGVA